MLKLAVTGCTGRMGKSLLQEILNHANCSLAAAVTRKNHELIGQDAGVLLDGKPLNIPIESEVLPAFTKADLILDFTSAEATGHYLEAALQLGKPILIGTTGLSQSQKDKLQQASQKIPVFFAPNMSFGIAVMRKLMIQATKMLGPDFDLSLREIHHRHKLDAPSGTTLQLMNDLEQTVGYSLYQRGSGKEQRPPRTIEVSVTRAGGVTGEHEVIFASEGEVFRISHSALNRRIFAQGALKAALWFYGKPAGFYTIDDLFASL